MNELNAYLREREHFVIYIEVQAYDDRDPLKRRRWTNETVTNREWFEHFHDQLYKKIEDDGFGIVFGTEQELHADIRRATDIRYHLELNNYLLIRDKKLYRRLPPGTDPRLRPRQTLPQGGTPPLEATHP